MTECPICNYHYSESRGHCPTCGACVNSTIIVDCSDDRRLVFPTLLIAHGAERARQLPESPRWFSLCDPEE